VGPVQRYRVFGRSEYAEPLEFRGTVSAAGRDDAAADALRRFGNRWVELVLLPEGAIHWILREQVAQAGDG
jgi:hypothetical protein